MDDIQTLAQTAVASFQRHYPTCALHSDETEEARQIAALAICEALATDTGERGPGAFVCIGRYAIIRELSRQWRQRGEPLHDALLAPDTPDTDTSDTEARIRQLAWRGRINGGQRARLAAYKDMSILRLRAQGLTETKIADALGMTKSGVHMALTRLRQRHY